MPFLVLGGAERLLSSVVRHLSDDGYRIVVVTTVAPGNGSGDTTAWFEAITAEIFHLPRFLEPSLWRGFIEHLIETRRVDLLWIAGSEIAYRLLPSLKQKYEGLHVVDLLFNTVGHAASNRRSKASIDITLVENREVADWLLAAGETEARIRVIASGIDLAHYAPVERGLAGCRSAVIRQAGLAEARFVVGFSGRLSEEKSPMTFLKIAAAVAPERDMSFVMTGAGPLERSVQAWQKQHERDVAGRRFRSLGVMADVRDVLSCYDVLVVPSRLDGRPLVVMEALAMGVPVIASRVGGLPEMIEDGVTGFLCTPGDVEAFADRLAWMQDNPQALQTCGWPRVPRPCGCSMRGG